jgi:sulfate transport system ATP-binding protein
VVPTPAGASDGAEVHAFVRPHDVRLSKAHDVVEAHDGVSVTLARIERLAFAGAYVKVTLRLPDESTLAVEMGQGEWTTLGLKEGDRVMTDMQDAKLFVGDYTI